MDHPVRFAASAIIVSAALGAIVMCLLVLRYGFATDDDDEHPGDRARRVLATRVGHAVAAVCFAASAVFAVVVLRAGTATTPAPPPSATLHAANRAPATREEPADREERAEMARLRAEIGELRSRMQALAAASVETAREPRTRELPERSTAVARAGSGRERSAARGGREADEAPSALPAGVSPRRIATTVRDVRLEIESWSTPRDVNYQVRLLDVAGRPVADAELTLDGRAVDGAPVRVAMKQTTERGVYRARVPHGVDPADLRLRVAAATRRFEVGLDAPTTW